MSVQSKLHFWWAYVVEKFRQGLRRHRFTPIPDGHARVFVYGSLKPGFYNFRQFPDLQVVAEDVVEDLTLMSLGSYPGAMPAPGKHITGVVLDVPVAEYERINRMETGAGYRPELLRTRGGYLATVYVFQNKYGYKMQEAGPTWTMAHQEGRGPIVNPSYESRANAK